VMLGAYAALTGVATRDQLVTAMTGLLPPYRRQHAEGNARALDLGISQVSPIPTGAPS